MSKGISEENPKGMTVDEIRALLDQCQLVEVPPDAVPIVRISLAGKIKRMEVKRP